MPLTQVFNQKTYKTAYHHGNYSGGYYDDVWIKTERRADSTGVNKRAGWKRLPQPAKSAPLDYFKEWYFVDRGRRYRFHTEKGPSGQFLYDYLDGPGGDVLTKGYENLAVGSDADYLATGKLLNRMRGEGSNIANMFAERKQTVKSIENLFNTIVYTARDLKRKNVSSAIRRLFGDALSEVGKRKLARKLKGQDIANQWLSLQYGWLPLCSDIYGLVMKQHQREKTRPRTFRVSKELTQMSNSSGWGSSVSTGDGKVHGVFRTSSRVSYMIRAFPDAVLAEPAALGVTNPLVVAWEVTPWSFVVDWFLPIGDYLDQLTASHGWIFYDGAKSVLTKVDAVSVWSWFNAYTSGGWDYTNAEGYEASGSYARFQRGTLTGFPSPKIPRFKNPLTLGHLANAVALSAQLFGKKRPPFDLKGSTTSPHDNSVEWKSISKWLRHN